MPGHCGYPRQWRLAWCLSTAKMYEIYASRLAALKGSGVGREGGHWSFDVFCEPKFVCMSLGEHRIPKWGV